MFQPSLFRDSTDHVVNVASVPQRSPFRYPGGKTWLVPRIRTWLTSLSSTPSMFFEPFAGGAIVGLTVAFEKLARHVTIVEIDAGVSAVWKTILSDEAPWLADQIENFVISPETVSRALSLTPSTTRELAFQTILANRTNRGGILAPGAGRIKTGEAGKGIASRWYPKTLSRRILDIYKIRDRLTFIEGDGIAIIQQNASRQDAVFFIDPPYTASGKSAGSRLYTHYQLDHVRLFLEVEKIRGDFLMTYDNAPEVQALAHEHHFAVRLIAMKNTHHEKKKELLIGRNLQWLD